MSADAAPRRNDGGIPIALTIAGSDSSGGAGIQADLKTFTAFGVYGASVLTALTAQNTRGVQGVHAVPPAFVTAQIDSVLGDLAVGAAKTGMLASREIVAAVAARLAAAPGLHLVVDPVMIATSGDPLIENSAVEAMIRELLPRATLVTPNLPEAAHLLGTGEARDEAAMADQAKALAALGCRAVLMKGGHAGGATVVDLLYDGARFHRFAAPRIDTRHTHGTGCSLSAAITALLACGETLARAVERAKAYVHAGLEAGRSAGIGHGAGPIDHLFAIRRQSPPA